MAGRGDPDIGKKYGFKPGVSGNPSGRAKGIAAKAQAYGDQCVQVLADALIDDDKKVRIMAAKELLDRAYGKPLTMTADVTSRLDDLDDATLDSAISLLQAAISPTDTATEGKSKATKH